VRLNDVQLQGARLVTEIRPDGHFHLAELDEHWLTALRPRRDAALPRIVMRHSGWGGDLHVKRFLAAQTGQCQVGCDQTRRMKTRDPVAVFRDQLSMTERGGILSLAGGYDLSYADRATTLIRGRSPAPADIPDIRARADSISDMVPCRELVGGRSSRTRCARRIVVAAPKPQSRERDSSMYSKRVLVEVEPFEYAFGSDRCVVSPHTVCDNVQTAFEVTGSLQSES